MYLNSYYESETHSMLPTNIAILFLFLKLAEPNYLAQNIAAQPNVHFLASFAWEVM